MYPVYDRAAKVVPAIPCPAAHPHVDHLREHTPRHSSHSKFPSPTTNLSKGHVVGPYRGKGATSSVSKRHQNANEPTKSKP